MISASEKRVEQMCITVLLFAVYRALLRSVRAFAFAYVSRILKMFKMSDVKNVVGYGLNGVQFCRMCSIE